MKPPQARNAIKKCLKALIDPKPKNQDKDKIWVYFKNRCAYCGDTLTKESRKGHIDHLHSEMEGGSNRLSNLVLTCATCNGDEKREANWSEFLAEKCGADSKAYRERSKQIANWVEINGGQPRGTLGTYLSYLSNLTVLFY
jgi:hypothetical protein